MIYQLMVILCQLHQLACPMLVQHLVVAIVVASLDISLDYCDGQDLLCSVGMISLLDLCPVLATLWYKMEQHEHLSHVLQVHHPLKW